MLLTTTFGIILLTMLLVFPSVAYISIGNRQVLGLSLLRPPLQRTQPLHELSTSLPRSKDLSQSSRSSALRSVGENVRFVAGFVVIAALVFTVTGKDLSMDKNAEEREETPPPSSPILTTASITTTSVVDNEELAKSLSDEASRLAVAEEADKQLRRAREEAEAKEQAVQEAAAKRVQSQVEAEKLLAEKEAKRQRVAWEEAERKRIQELHRKQAEAEKKEVEEALVKAKEQQALLKAEEEVRAQAEAEARAEVEAEAERFRLDEKMRMDTKAETSRMKADTEAEAGRVAEARKREKDGAAYSSNEKPSTRVKKTGSAVPAKKSARTMAHLLDQMQASAEATGGTKDSAKRLDKAITIFAKTPISVLRETITAVNSDLLPAIGSDLDAHIRSGLEGYWLAYGDWNSMLTALENDLGPQAEQTSSWMRMAVSAGNELSENRLKELIKARGGTSAVPRAKRGSKKVSKTVYLTALIDLLRAESDNNYELVHKVLILESDSASGGNKGFGS